ncbi:hypothetical protein ACE6H2_023934 [Prunus campanulata]
MKERRRRGKKVENNGGVVEVLPIEFPKTSMPRVMVDYVSKFMDEIPDGSKVRAFAKGMFLCQESRERGFVNWKILKPGSNGLRVKWVGNELEALVLYFMLCCLTLYMV